MKNKRFAVVDIKKFFKERYKNNKDLFVRLEKEECERNGLELGRKQGKRV